MGGPLVAVCPRVVFIRRGEERVLGSVKEGRPATWGCRMDMHKTKSESGKGGCGNEEQDAFRITRIGQTDASTMAIVGDELVVCDAVLCF